MFLSKRTLLHRTARLRILAQQPARSGGSIGLGSIMILAAAQIVRPFAAPLNVHDPEED
jgi:hypothetical protein